MIEFLSLKIKSFALDISDLSLKIIKLKKKGNFLKLASWGETGIKPGIIEDGEIKNEDAFSQTIKEAISRSKGERLKTDNVIVSLPEKKAFLTVIQMPRMEEKELKMALPFEAENHIPMPIDEVYLDFQVIKPLDSSLDHLDVLVAAFPKNIIDSYLSCLKKAGLNVWAMEVESLALCRDLLKKEVSPYPVLIVDFGGSSTDFIIFSGHSIRFTFSSPISSRYLDQTISRSLNISLQKAESLKLKYGLRAVSSRRAAEDDSDNDGKISKKDISDAMIPVLADLTGQIKRYLFYYQTHANHEHLSIKSKGIQKVILCGSGANLKSFANFLSLSLKMPVELGNPWINVLPDTLKRLPALPFEESLGYATALGLALRGIDTKI